MIPNITTCQNILNVKNHHFYKLKSLEFIIEDIIGLTDTSDQLCNQLDKIRCKTCTSKKREVNLATKQSELIN